MLNVQNIFKDVKNFSSYKPNPTEFYPMDRVRFNCHSEIRQTSDYRKSETKLNLYVRNPKLRSSAVFGRSMYFAKCLLKARKKCTKKGVAKNVLQKRIKVYH